jgi:hypothetical protein
MDDLEIVYQKFWVKEETRRDDNTIYTNFFFFLL